MSLGCFNVSDDVHVEPRFPEHTGNGIVCTDIPWAWCITLGYCISIWPVCCGSYVAKGPILSTQNGTRNQRQEVHINKSQTSSSKAAGGLASNMDCAWMHGSPSTVVDTLLVWPRPARWYTTMRPILGYKPPMIWLWLASVDPYIRNYCVFVSSLIEH